MRLNKILFYLSVTISVISLTTAIILSFCIKSEITLFISNVLLNIFAGTIIMIATTTVDYFLQRRKILTTLMTKILKYRSEFTKINYLELEENIATYEEYVNYYKKENSSIKATKEMYNNYRNEELSKIKESMSEIINVYIEIANNDFEDVWKLYDELYFLGSNKKKRYLYTEVFNYIYDFLNCFRYYKYQFNEIKDYRSNYEDIKELQNKVFYYEEKDSNIKDFEYDGNRIFIHSWGGNAMRGKDWFIVNKVEEHLTNMFNEIGKIAYFNKNYNGIREEQEKEDS